MKLRSFSLAVIVLALVATTAFAGDKIFRLKNGRKIQGELVEETPTSYIVRSSSGKVTLSKDSVSAVEDPPPESHFLEPEKKKPAPETPTTDDTPPTRPSGTDRGGDSGSGSTPSQPRSDTPSSGPASPLASDSDIADMKKALLAVPTVRGGDDTVNQMAARTKALDDIAKKPDALRILVAIASEPVNAAHPTAPPERQVAVDLINSQKFPPESIRPLVIQAIAGINLETGSPRDLLGLIFSVGDSDDGAVGTALLAKVAEVLQKGQSPVAIMEPLERVVKPTIHLRRLFELVLLPDKSDSGDALAQLCKKIVTNQIDPEPAYRALTGVINPNKLPPLPRLASGLEVLGTCRSRDGADAVARILDALERIDPATKPQGLTAALRSGYSALVSIWTPETRERIFAALDTARSSEQRVLVLEGFRAIKPGFYALDHDFAQGLIDRMSDRSRTDEEIRGFSLALGVVCNKSLGNDPAAWQNYLDSQGR